MEVEVRNPKGKYLTRIIVDQDITIAEFKRLIQKKFPSLYPKRQSYYIQKDGKDSPIVFLEDTDSLANYGIQGGEVLYFSDLGAQINTRLAYTLENLGPVLFLLFFCLYPQFIWDDPSDEWGRIQLTGFILGLAHFIRRVLECLFVHTYSNATIPLAEFLLGLAHYWGLFGILVCYFLFHPFYTSPAWDKWVCYGLIGGFLFTELMNCCCHFILMTLRVPGDFKDDIPWGFGFGWVSCANYLWELLGLILYSVLINTFTGYLFTVVSGIRMTLKALKKHKIYLKEFDGKEGRPLYPRERKALFPFIL